MGLFEGHRARNENSAMDAGQESQNEEDPGGDEEARRVKQNEGSPADRENAQADLAEQMHEILVVRCFHDQRTADIPIIVVHWSEAQMDTACKYWLALSEDEWTEQEKIEKYKALKLYFQTSGATPVLEEVDRVLRALIHDPAVGYVPAFTVLLSLQKGYKARFIFTRPDFAPPQQYCEVYPAAAMLRGVWKRIAVPWTGKRVSAWRREAPLFGDLHSPTV
ncbi:hypothetical protein NMY22_g19926 [Coprinellus aureogranulatus]|nr:hypothetical protein NMY22_g19926 [Coprinellus aureogranulatus]